jgi:hypothetical protein
MVPLTSGQIQQTLDKLLNFAISLVIQNSKIVHNSMPALVSFAAVNKRRKIDRLGSNLVIHHGTAFLVNDPTPERYIACKFNRHITYMLIKQYLISTDQTAVDATRKKAPEFLLIRVNVADALKAYDEFRAELLNGYTPLCFKEALLLNSKSSLPINIDDLVQNLKQAVLYALDRFDSEKGALTSFIQQWMRHFFQSPEFGHSVGLAFNTSHFARRQIARKTSAIQNVGYSLTPKILGTFQPLDSAEDTLVRQQDQKLLVMMLQKIDPLGLLRTLHQVEEQWTSAHQQQKERLYANA